MMMFCKGICDWQLENGRTFLWRLGRLSTYRVVIMETFSAHAGRNGDQVLHKLFQNISILEIVGQGGKQ